MINRVDWTCHSALVVDDESAIRELVARFLRSRGMTVLEAENGRAALDRLDSEGASITLLIADLVMPKMGGLQLLERLRQSNPSLPALLISGFYEDSNSLTKALGEQTSLLPKPFSLQGLATAVDNLVSERLAAPA